MAVDTAMIAGPGGQPQRSRRIVGCIIVPLASVLLVLAGWLALSWDDEQLRAWVYVDNSCAVDVDVVLDEMEPKHLDARSNLLLFMRTGEHRIRASGPMGFEDVLIVPIPSRKQWERERADLQQRRTRESASGTANLRDGYVFVYSVGTCAQYAWVEVDYASPRAANAASSRRGPRITKLPRERYFELPGDLYPAGTVNTAHAPLDIDEPFPSSIKTTATWSTVVSRLCRLQPDGSHGCKME